MIAQSLTLVCECVCAGVCVCLCVLCVSAYVCMCVCAFPFACVRVCAIRKSVIDGGVAIIFTIKIEFSLLLYTSWFDTSRYLRLL